jgi:hypothetical protein
MPLALKQRPDKPVRSGAMRSETHLLSWAGTAFVVSLGLAISVLAPRGITTKSLGLALQLTARWAFVPFWLAYAGGAIASLFGPIFEPLARRG